MTFAAEALKLVGTDGRSGLLDQYFVLAQPNGVVFWLCRRCAGGHVTIIARNLEGDQTDLTLGEMVRAALEHESERHETGGCVQTVEEYAIELVANGAESTAEDDLNEDDKIAEADHQAACDLAIKIAQAIRANPNVLLGLVEDRPQVVRIEGDDEDIADALAGPS